MGSGLSVISENEKEMIIRYSKDLKLEEAITIIKHESEKKSKYLINNINNNDDDDSNFNDDAINIVETNIKEIKTDDSINIVETNIKQNKTVEVKKKLLSPEKKIISRNNSKIIKTRRKSYDINDVKSKSPTTVVLTPSSSEIMSTDNVIEKNLTCNYWDSVTEQPFCDICLMAFKSNVHLERHIKFSDLHSKNQKKDKEDEVASVPNNELKREFVEGKDYKLLYYGSKFYWKNSETVDIYIYQYIYFDCIEVITFDLQRNRELKRIYLSFIKLMEIIKPDVINAVDLQRSERIICDRFAVLEDRDEMIESVSRHKLITYILSRLQYSITSKNCDKNIPEIAFVLNHETIFDPLIEKQKEIIPIQIPFRRRSSTEEITNVINSLQSIHCDLKSSVAKAEICQKQGEKAIDNAFKAFGELNLKHVQKDSSDSSISKYKSKWLSTFRKITLKNAVEKTRNFLKI